MLLKQLSVPVGNACMTKRSPVLLFPEVDDFSCARPCLCSRLVAAAVEGRDDITLLRVSVRVGRNCGRTKGTLSLAQPLDLPQARPPTILHFICTRSESA